MNYRVEKEVIGVHARRPGAVYRSVDPRRPARSRAARSDPYGKDVPNLLGNSLTIQALRE